MRELPRKNIDTGMGLERVAFIKQGVENLYEIDQVRPVLDRAAELSGRAYGAQHEDDVRMRVVADHVRSALMVMADGVTPSNEGRGYILRRLLRRTVRAMRLLGVDDPVFAELFPASRDAMKAAYPEVATNFDADRPARLRGGGNLPRHAGQRHEHPGSGGLPHQEGRQERTRRGHRVPAARHLRLPDRPHPGDGGGGRSHRRPGRVRHPDDRTAEQGESRRQGEEDAARRPVRVQRLPGARARPFSPATSTSRPTAVLGLIVDGVAVDHAVEGDIAEVILAETSLYPESGGQEADAGKHRRQRVRARGAGRAASGEGPRQP